VPTHWHTAPVRLRVMSDDRFTGEFVPTFGPAKRDRQGKKADQLGLAIGTASSRRRKLILVSSDSGFGRQVATCAFAVPRRSGTQTSLGSTTKSHGSTTEVSSLLDSAKHAEMGLISATLSSVATSPASLPRGGSARGRFAFRYRQPGASNHTLAR